MIQIHDLNNNPLAIVSIGKAKTRLGYVRILQPIEFAQLKGIVDNFNNLVNLKIYNNQLYRLLQSKNVLLRHTFSKLSPLPKRRKRWDSIGTLFKWIAGTPDAEDLRIINSTMNKIINENNNQVFINHAINGRIFQISQLTNELIQLDHKSQQQHDIEINLLTIISNIDAIQQQLENLEDAILLAKHGIMSSRIISIKDYIKIKGFLEGHQMKVSSYEDLLSKATTQIAMNTTHIVFIMKIPQLSLETYDFEFIDSLIQNQKRISLGSHFILKNETHVFETKEKCTKDNDLYICNSETMNLSNECIKNLINIQHANCTYEKAYSNGTIKHLTDDMILLNNVNITLQSNCSNNTQILKGSFLIQFEQCNLQLGNNQFSNFIMEISSKSYRPTTGLIAMEQDIIDRPTPEYIGNLTLQHRNMINHVYLKYKSLKWNSTIFGTISISITLIVASITLLYIFLTKKITKANIEVDVSIKTPSAPEDSPAKSPYPDVSDERFKELLNYINMPTSDRTI